ncbi:MAG TPA: hypothetical protein VGI10_08650 [Polyangiaceae bacterium]
MSERVEFFSLARPIQERFVGSCAGTATPAPLAVAPLVRDPRVLAWCAAGVAAAVGGIFALRSGYGDLHNAHALAPVWLGGVYTAFFVGSGLAFLRAAARLATLHAVPYRPARYLFPVGVIDARSPGLVLYAINEQTKIEHKAGRLRLDFSGASFEFTSADPAALERAASSIDELRKRLETAGPDSSGRELALRNPLIDNGFKNPFSPPEPMKRSVPLWTRLWPLIGVAVGALIGFASWLERNSLSAHALYAAARAADNTEAYQSYLARGGTNPDVIPILLPRAELRDAQKTPGVAPLEEFAKSHPDTKIGPEVEVLLHNALMKELADTEAQGTLSAIKAFDAHYGHYDFLQREIERATNVRVRATFVALQPALNSQDPAVAPFFDRLLRYAAKHGPALDIVFVQRPSETVEGEEKVLRKSGYFAGETSLPSHAFDAEHEAPREARIAGSISAILGKALPADMLAANPPKHLDSATDPTPTVPTILFSYHVEMSGAFTSSKPRLVICGIGLMSHVTFSIPDDKDVLSFKFSAWRSPDLRIVPEGATAVDLYEDLAKATFSKLGKKYLQTLFSETAIAGSNSGG